MKKINIFLALMLLLVVSACDIVEPPYKKDNSVEPVDTTKRKVLIEDFTGFRCGNCPEASHVAEQIADLYKGNVIVLGLHAGPLSIPTPGRKYNFRTTETLEIADFYGLTATPYGMVNRRKFNDQTLQSPSAWSGFVTETLALPADLKIEITPNYNETTKEISANIKLNYIKASEENQFVAVYIVEDSIVQYQQDDRMFPNIHVLDYVHNHVVRGSMSGTWGTQISSSIIAPGAFVNIPLSYIIPDTKDWRPNKLSLVAFVHNNNTKEILQVEKVKLIAD